MAKLTLLTFLAVGLFELGGAALADGPDTCMSSAVIVPVAGPGPYTVASSPDGNPASGRTLIQSGFYIDLTIVDGIGQGISYIQPSDFWLESCDPTQDLVILCGGAGSSAADSMTNDLGKTTISQTTIAASNNPTIDPIGNPFGCVDGMLVEVMGDLLLDPATGCTTFLCLNDIHFRGYDLTGDGVITPADLSTFAGGFPPNPFERCTDYNGDGANTLADLSTWAFSFGPPGDSCGV
jgi:hypothetical protein